jgi:very-short-patch-repair endonuclease
MTIIDRRIVAAATGQLGILSRQRAHDASITDKQLRSRVSSGFLRQIGPNSFELAGNHRGPRAELLALITDLRGTVFASGPTAAALHGFDGYPLRAPFDVLILRGRNVRRIGHRIHTTQRLDLIDRASVEGIPVISGARTLIDLANVESVERLRIAYDSGLRDGKFNESHLHRRVVALRSSGRHGIPHLLEAIEGSEIVSGAHSWLERAFLRLLADAHLPRPDTQVVLSRAEDRLVRVDFRFPTTSVVVEVLGYRYHSSPEQLRRDAVRMNALLTDGYRPYQFTYEQVVDQPDSVVAEVRAALDGTPPQRFV